jgi:hypothetical protein
MCPEINRCKFITRFKDSKDPVLKGLIRHYCHGNENKDCIRKNLYPSNVPGELIPTGEIYFKTEKK